MALQLFWMLGTACARTQRHITEDLNGQSQTVVSVRLLLNRVSASLIVCKYPLLCNNDNDNYVALYLSKVSYMYCVVILHCLSSWFVKFWLYIMYKLIHMLQFVSQFLPVQGPSSHIVIVFCGASPKLSRVSRFSWLYRFSAIWSSSRGIATSLLCHGVAAFCISEILRSCCVPSL